MFIYQRQPQGAQFVFHKTFENSIISLEFAGKYTLSLTGFCSPVAGVMIWLSGPLQGAVVIVSALFNKRTL